MNSKKVPFSLLTILFILIIIPLIMSYNSQPEKKQLVFKNNPGLIIGFSTQNFLKAMPLNVTSLTEIIGYGAKEGYQFVEIRDQFVDLTTDDCRALAEVAKKNNVDLVYVFNSNPLDPGYYPLFERALSNVLVLPGPGILRALASKTEFDTDPARKGWSKDELLRIAAISDNCSAICKSKNIQFVFENSREAFFGDGSTYYGLTDLFASTTGPGLQLDIANLFMNSSRVTNDPEKILKYLPGLGNRWVETHLKTVHNGEPQPVLADNPISVVRILELMRKQNVKYVALELAAVESKQQCFDNHAESIQYLKDNGILEK
jgi:sugar phosphate isomerase/epimerase